MALDELKGSTVNAKLWAPVTEVESEALNQLRNIINLPWVAHVAVMPDVHYGKGATVGSVIAMRGAVAPAAVGVDIGCGMGAIKTNLTASDLPDSLKDLRNTIEQEIPVGFSEHGGTAWTCLTGSKEVLQLQNEINVLFSEFDALHEKVSNLDTKAMRQLGTLGGGNHFIELCLDTNQQVWLMLHSGSRNIGKSLAEIHINIARKLTHNKALPDRDLAVFLAKTPEMDAYRRDLYWAQRYAFLNRRVMFEIYKDVMRTFFKNVTFEEPILCHHNYVSEEMHFDEDLVVTRKGAISATVGELGVIPGSMGTKSYVVRGLGNAESLTSASHGAGRRMSRGAAKRAFNTSDLEAQTQGVECRKDNGVLDEIPGAYKDIDQVMKNQADLVEVVAELKGIMCIKG